METPNNLFKEKTPLEKQKEEISELLSDLQNTTSSDHKELYSIVLNVGQKYLDLAKIIAKKANTELTANIESLIYTAEASKFYSDEAVKEIRKIQDSTLFLNAFLLALDESSIFNGAHLTLIWDYFVERQRLFFDENTPAGKLKNHLYRHLLNFYQPLNIVYDLSPVQRIDAKQVRIKTAEFLISMLSSFEPNIEDVFQLIQLSKDSQLLSLPYIQAYADYFFHFAKEYPAKFVALPSSEKIIFFISEVYFANNEIAKELECLSWFKQNQFKTSTSKNADIKQEIEQKFDEIFYGRVIKCCEQEPYFVAELLQYFREISKNYAIQTTQGLLNIVKDLYYSGSFEYIKVAFSVTKRICQSIPKEFYKSPKTAADMLSLNALFIRFYNVNFQLDSLLKTILPLYLATIDESIDKLKNGLTGFFTRKPSLKEEFQKLKASFNIPEKLEEWKKEQKELKIAESTKKIEEIIKGLETFQKRIEQYKNVELTQLIVKLRSDLIELPFISSTFNEITELKISEKAAAQITAENSIDSKDVPDSKSEEEDEQNQDQSVSMP